jgi:hypothetical protein
MDAMHQEQHWIANPNSDDYSASHHYEFPPTPTLAQITMGDYYEFDDKSHVDLGFISGSFLDSSGVTRPLTYPDIDAFDAVRVIAQPGMASAVYGARASNAAGSYVVNFFFWGEVS